MKSIIRLFSMALIVIADQLLKLWAQSSLEYISTMPVIEGVFHLTYTTNRGVAFGLFSNNREIFIVITIIILVLASYALFVGKIDHWLTRLGITLIISGGVGNLIDRIFRGYVIDFLEFRAIQFPVFNLADICITIGCIITLISVLLIERISKADKDPDNSPKEEEQASLD